MCAMNPRLLRPLATGFNPKSISGLALWLDAADNSTLTMNSSTVEEIRDKSGNARNFAQSTAANQPTLSTINGRQCLESSTVRIMNGNAAANALTQNVPGLTIVAVGKIPSNAAADLVFFSTATSSAVGRVALRSNGAATGVLTGGRRLDSNGFQSVEHVTARVPAIHAGVFDYTNSDLFLYLNGTLAASSTSFQTNGSSENTASMSASILGAATDSLLGELLIWRRVLTASEFSYMTRAIGRKWGITVA